MTYLGYKEVSNLLKCSKGRAYEIIFELRKRSKWLETYECQNLGRIVIPKRILLNYFPSCRQAIKEIEKKEVSA